LDSATVSVTVFLDHHSLTASGDHFSHFSHSSFLKKEDFADSNKANLNSVSMGLRALFYALVHYNKNSILLIESGFIGDTTWLSYQTKAVPTITKRTNNTTIIAKLVLL
jgi:hypothetical protein